MNKDTVVGLVGGVVLVAAMVGIFLYERGNAAIILGDDAPAPPAWENVTASGPGATDTVALNGEKAATLAVDAANLTEVTFTLTWRATNGRDTLAFDVDPPEGVLANQTLTAEGDSGTLEITVKVRNDPLQGPGTLGMGDWDVKVRFLRATGAVPGAPVPVQPDQSVTWTLSTSLVSYEAKADA